jgi:hypothetical protein
MKPDSFIRVLAGVMVLISVALAHFVNSWWLLFTGFIALNLIQSAFTGFCPPEWLARKLGWIKACAAPCADKTDKTAPRL